MSKVYISHVEEDADLALTVAQGLEDAGYSTWYYERDSLPGVSYLIQTGQEIEACSVFLLVVSETSVQSHQVSREVERAHECAKIFLPLLLDMSIDEFHALQPMWRQAVGTRVINQVSSTEIDTIVPRILKGFAQLGIEPAGKADAESLETEKSGRISKGNEKIRNDLGGRVALEGDKTFIFGTKPSGKGIYGRSDLALKCAKLIVSQTCDFLCLHGAGGIGKSSVAALIASRIVEDNPDDFERIIWYDLRNNPDPETTLLHLLTVITGCGIDTESPGKPSFDMLLNILKTGLTNSPTLVVLDNLDTIFDRNADAGSFIDERWPSILHVFLDTRSAVIVTSRQIPKFQDKSAVFIRVDGIASEDGISLMRDAGLKDNADTLADAHALLQGHPMALNALSAAVNRRPSYRSRLASAGDIMEILRQCPYKANSPVALFEEIIEPNYLPEVELSLLLSMPVLSRAEPAEAVTALNPELEFGDVVAALDELYLRSLVEVDTEVEPPLYSLHALIRDVAQRNLGNLNQLHERVYDYYKSLPWDGDLNNPGEVEHLRLAVLHALSIKDLERAKIILYGDTVLSDRLIGWGRFDLALPLHQEEYSVASESGDAVDRMRSAHLLSKCLLMVGHTEDSLKHAESALEIAEGVGDKVNQGRYRRHIGRILFLQGEFDQSYELLEGALETAVETGDQKGEGRIRRHKGQILMHRGEFDKALEELEQAHKIAVENNDRVYEIESLMAMSRIYYFRGEGDEAVKLLLEAQSITAESGDKLNQSKILGLLGQIQVAMGDFESALVKFHEALKVDAEIGDRRHGGAIHAQLAMIYNIRGEHEKAIDFLEESIDIAVEIKSKAAEAFRRGLIGEAYLGMGDLEKAMEQFRHALSFSVESKDKTNECAWRGMIGEVYLGRGEHDDAEKWLDDALVIALELKDKDCECQWRGQLGQLRMEQDKYDLALLNLEKALELALEIKSPVHERCHRLNLGKLHAAAEHFEIAVTHFEKVLSITKELGMGNAYIDEVERELALSRDRNQAN